MIVEMSRKQLVASIAREWTEETGEKTTAAQADVLLDRMADAFCEAFAGDHDTAVRNQPSVAGYLVWKWTGADRKALRAAITRYNERQAA